MSAMHRFLLLTPAVGSKSDRLSRVELRTFDDSPQRDGSDDSAANCATLKEREPPLLRGGSRVSKFGLVVATTFARGQSSPSWWRLIRTTSPGLKGGPGAGMTAVEVLQFET